MRLLFRVLNHEHLSDGGPTTASVDKEILVIGRAQPSQWILPDPTKIISKRHCEIRFENGAYWLWDFSANGTFVNRSDRRMVSPHRLRGGDEFHIGEDVRYVIGVELFDRDDAAPAQGDSASARPAGNPWGAGQSARKNPWVRQSNPGPRVENAVSASPPPAIAPRRQDDSDGLLELLLQAAGIAPELVQDKDPVQVVEEVGRALQVSVERLRKLLAVREGTRRRIVGSGEFHTGRTKLGPTGNNPLKTSQSADEAFTLMFSEGPGYLNLEAAVTAAFDDLTSHTGSTFAAILPAVEELLDELSPKSIEAKSGGARKPKLWEAYVELWKAKVGEGRKTIGDEFWRFYSRQYSKLDK